MSRGDPPLRLTPCQRLDMMEEFQDLAGMAMRLRHKHAKKLAETRPETLDNRTLATAILRLKGWIAERTEAAKAV